MKKTPAPKLVDYLAVVSTLVGVAGAGSGLVAALPHVSERVDSRALELLIEVFIAIAAAGFATLVVYSLERRKVGKKD